MICKQIWENYASIALEFFFTYKTPRAVQKLALLVAFVKIVITLFNGAILL